METEIKIEKDSEQRRTKSDEFEYLTLPSDIAKTRPPRAVSACDVDSKADKNDTNVSFMSAGTTASLEPKSTKGSR